MGRPKAPVNEYTPTDLPADHVLVVLGVPRGSNNFSSTDPEGTERLLELSAKIRRFVLATRGDFAIAKLFPPPPGKEGAKEGGLAGEIVYVATPRDVKDWKKAGEWPTGFGQLPEAEQEQERERDLQDEDGEEEDSDTDSLPPNPNH